MGYTKEEYSNLDYMYEFYNRVLFGGELPDLIFTYQYKGRFDAFYHPVRFGSRTKKGPRIAEIALNARKVVGFDDIEVGQCIVHEMCHHWQHVFDKPSRSGYHNKRWGAKMIEVGLMPSDTGKPGGKQTGQNMADYPIEGGLFLRATKQLIESGYTVQFEVPYTQADLARIQGGPQVAANVTTVKETPIILKTKYVCPCGNAVWGKPGLKIICGECEKKFQISRV